MATLRVWMGANAPSSTPFLPEGEGSQAPLPPGEDWGEGVGGETFGQLAFFWFMDKEER